MPTILESELEDYLFQKANITAIAEIIPGYSKLYRQLEIGNCYGRADLVCCTITDPVAQCATVEVIELKKDIINISTLDQAAGYVAGLDKFFEEKLPDYAITFNVCLVGGSIDLSSNFIYACKLIENLRLYTYELSLTEGISFKEIKPHNYSRRNNVFGSSTKPIEDWFKAFEPKEPDNV